MLRPRKLRKARNNCGSADIIVHKDLQSLSGLLDKTLDVKTLSKPKACTHQFNIRQMRSVKSSQATDKSDARHR
jgi:hypothetical protein